MILSFVQHIHIAENNVFCGSQTIAFVINEALSSNAMTIKSLGATFNPCSNGQNHTFDFKKSGSADLACKFLDEIYMFCSFSAIKSYRCFIPTVITVHRNFLYIKLLEKYLYQIPKSRSNKLPDWFHNY